MTDAMTHIDSRVYDFKSSKHLTQDSLFAKKKEKKFMYVEYVKCNEIISKPAQAMMRPDRVSASYKFGAKHLAYMERQTDEQMDET